MAEAANPWVEKFAELETDVAVLDKEVKSQVYIIHDDPFTPRAERSTIADIVKFAEAVELHRDALKQVKRPKDDWGKELPDRGIDKYGDLKWRHIANAIGDGGLQYRGSPWGSLLSSRDTVDRITNNTLKANKDTVPSFGYWILSTYFNNPEDIPVEVFEAFMKFGVGLHLKFAMERESAHPNQASFDAFKNASIDTVPQFQPSQNSQSSSLQETLARYRVEAPNFRPWRGPA